MKFYFKCLIAGLLFSLVPICMAWGMTSDQVTIILMASDGESDGVDEPIEDLLVDDTNDLVTRGLFVPVSACLSGSIVSVSFEPHFTSVLIRIFDEDADTIVYEERQSCPVEWKINLLGKGKGDYLLWIEADGNVYEGYFSL